MKKNHEQAKKFLRQQSREQLLRMLEQSKEDVKNIADRSKDYELWLETTLLIGEELAIRSANEKKS